MNIDSLKKIWSKYNPLACLRRNNMRRRLSNHNITFLCPNCIGGILFHDLGLQFMSPTVNLMMTQTDFVKFVLNMDFYLAQKLEFYKHPEYECPCAYLGNISIHFTHYKSREEAESKWKERTARIQPDNVFVFLEERDELTKKEILELNQLKVKGLVVFTANTYDDIPYTISIQKYHNDGEIGNILTRSFWNDAREYEYYFDFVKWFNEANGGNYDVSPFVRVREC